MYRDLLNLIKNANNLTFEEVTALINKYVEADDKFIETLKQIGAIPEYIAHDSTEEKLFSKASDAVLARAFREIGLNAVILKERGDSADIFAQSSFFGYALVADAKAFRLSRTAKNQKDFKIAALSAWRQDAEYAVLCSPYFQYPSRNSQIYAQALTNNVCLISWEHLIFLIQQGIKEHEGLNLSQLWNFCDSYSHKVLCADMQKCFIEPFNEALLGISNLKKEAFIKLLRSQVATITERGNQEKGFWLKTLAELKNYSREKAIEELIKARKIHEKIAQIDAYIGGLRT